MIGRLDITSVVKTLGVHFDLQNNFTSQYECMWNKLEDISIKLKGIAFDQTNAIKHYNRFIMPRAAFGCVVINADAPEMKNMQERMERMIVQSLKMPEKMSRKLLQMKKEDGGFGMVNFLHRCNMVKLKKLIGALRINNNIGKIIRKQIEVLQAYSGFSTNVMEINASTKFWKLQ